MDHIPTIGYGATTRWDHTHTGNSRRWTMHIHTYGRYGASSIQFEFDRFGNEDEEEASRCHRRNKRHGSTETQRRVDGVLDEGNGNGCAMQCESITMVCTAVQYGASRTVSNCTVQ